MTETPIEWTQRTWNPLVGCSKISPGCTHCYAEKAANSPRLQKFPQYHNVVNQKGWTGHIELVRHKLDEPIKRKKPTMWFVNSMSDLFHDNVPVDYIQEVFAVMNQTPQHTYQVLTKRGERLLELAPQITWSENIWMGVSLENKDCLFRADHLRQVPCKIRWLSCEPLLGPLVLKPLFSSRDCAADDLDLTGINWVVVGGESGANYRSLNLDWARDIRDRCLETGIPFFFKQVGGKTPKAKGRLLDGRTWDEMPTNSK